MEWRLKKLLSATTATVQPMQSSQFPFSWGKNFDRFSVQQLREFLPEWIILGFCQFDEKESQISSS